MMAFGLPNSWAVSSLGHLGVWNGGGTPTKSNAAFWEGDIPWVSPKDVKVAKLWDSADHISSSAIEASATTLIAKQSVLVVTRSGILAHTLPVATNEVPLAINQDLKAITPFEGIDAEYLAWALRALQRHILKECSKHGTTVHSIESLRFQAFDIPVAPLREQRRIVAKIEELFSELGKGIESLKTAQAQLKVYRQAVLKHVFEGKLTAQWREENKDKLEKPEQLLARIKQERETRYEQQLKEWKVAVKTWEGNGKRGKRPRKPRTPNPTKNSFKDFAAESNHLPFGWTWTTIGSLFDVVSGATPKGLEQAKGDGTPFYKVSDMNALGNETRMDSATIYLSETERNDLGLTAYPRGTIIFPKRGGAILTNKKRLLSRLSCFDLNTMGVINSLASISTEYLWHWFQSLDLAKIYDGSNVPQINNKNVEPLLFPICSIEEQREVSSILEKVLSLVDETEADISRELWKAETLRQSVLKKAFSGQLVPQDPRDEPASVLLDRIHAAKGVEKRRKKA